ncbi:hypothetical protein ISG08_20835 [Burkholderia pseudomallei]|uniref:hypothetical protein n=1 Tax=Burkholderia pseudomallei TaxID=28450 RepID=UPI0003D8898A|nr:hypothetical protein [Burkholderia pseudomallei]AHE34727.1 hypothetical protein BBS_40 [Burkholderia pseudomallei NAU20B-16]AHG35756.1 hypothetical protein BBQ_1974 [Burkholderia pseudomallei MSHR511]AHG67488.1 hypothetical protein BBN_2100 [Burkholderia pseudomallei MSHR146]AJX38234.1 hypothetical protein DP45_02689 [Burkholderia pseudomallei]ALJ69816.1 hypothetical protein TR70_0224 [Burkholderia pseudomallei]
METAVSTIPGTCMTNEQAYDRALEVLLSAAGLARTRAILAEVIVEFRKREPGNTCDRERAFAFGPDLLARAREMAEGDALESVEQR